MSSGLDHADPYDDVEGIPFDDLSLQEDEFCDVVKALIVGLDNRVVRRYDPLSKYHVSFDESTGQRVIRSGALLFQDDGCSVSITSILDSFKLPYTVISDSKYAAVAIADVSAIYQIKDENNVNVFTVIEDPQQGLVGATHGLIPYQIRLSTNQERKKASALAKKFQHYAP